jgi:hypothetical protein
MVLTVTDRLKRAAWLRLAPLLIALRPLVASLHIGRQQFVLGRLAPGRSADGLRTYLLGRGFEGSFAAWVDDGEAWGLRWRPDFARQYHLRAFADGELRGHYEFTPESHPWKHFWEVGLEPRREEFLRILGDWITPTSSPEK